MGIFRNSRRNPLTCHMLADISDSRVPVLWSRGGCDPRELGPVHGQGSLGGIGGGMGVPWKSRVSLSRLGGVRWLKGCWG